MNATANALQAHGRELAMTSEAGRSLFPTPSNRKSIMATEPTPPVRASTWMVSTMGKHQVDSAMAIANGRCSSQVTTEGTTAVDTLMLTGSLIYKLTARSDDTHTQ